MRKLTCLLFLLGAVTISARYGYYFTDHEVPSVDLPGHIALTESLIDTATPSNLLRGAFSFYDSSTYTGWPALRLDGPLPYALTALLSALLSPWSDEPTRLAAHLLTLLGISLLPLSFAYAAKPLTPEFVNEQESSRKQLSLLSAVAAVGASIWFLNHDYQYYGIGAAAVMNIGLYCQLYGWHFMLVVFGSALRVTTSQPASRRDKLVGIFSLALLSCSHIQTLVFTVGMLCFFILFFWDSKWPLLQILALGLSLSGLYLVPTAALQGTYSAYDTHRLEGDLWTLLFRYPWIDLLRAVARADLSLLATLDPVHLTTPLVAAYLLCSKAVRVNRPLAGTVTLILVATISSSSPFIVASLPLAIHYYRYFGFLFILSTLVLVAVSQTLPRSLPNCRHKTANILVGLFWMLTISASFTAPHPRLALVKNNLDTPYLENADKVLEFLAARNQEKLPFRVYIEQLDFYDKFPYLAPHYIASRVKKLAGFETISNIFLQRSLAYRFATFSAEKLTANTYKVPILFDKKSDIDPRAALDQMVNLGTTHIVAGTEKFKETLAQLGLNPTATFGSYAIYEISPNPFAQIAPSKKVILGYWDESGSLPFNFIEYYFYSRRELYLKFELVALKSTSSIPEAIDGLLINGSSTETLALATRELPTFRLAFVPTTEISQTIENYTKSHEERLFVAIERYLDSTYNLQTALSSVTGRDTNKVVTNGVFSWQSNNQAISLSELTPGEIYRLNYSYFPYWQSTDGEVLRGTAERMFFIPNSSEARLTYSAWSSTSTWVGLIATIFASLVIFKIFRTLRLVN